MGHIGGAGSRWGRGFFLYNDSPGVALSLRLVLVSGRLWPSSLSPGVSLSAPLTSYLSHHSANRPATLDRVGSQKLDCQQAHFRSWER